MQYSSIKVNEIPIYATTQMNLKNIILSQRNQTQRPNIVSFHLHKMSRNEKSQTQKVMCAMKWGWRMGSGSKGDGVSLLSVLEFDSSDNCTGFWICQKREINTL